MADPSASLTADGTDPETAGRLLPEASGRVAGGLLVVNALSLAAAADPSVGFLLTPVSGTALMKSNELSAGISGFRGDRSGTAADVLLLLVDVPAADSL